MTGPETRLCPRCDLLVPPDAAACPACGGTHTMIGSGSRRAAAPGTAPDVFGERYRIIDRLGTGGFGTVYRAHDTTLRIDVALKVTNAAVADPEVLQRFEREARVIARLNHENIVKIYDAGVAGGMPFYAMELVEGDTLQQLIEANKILPVRAAVRIARDVALALHHAHLQGVVHRDVKPHNIMVQPRAAAPDDGRPEPAASISTSRGVLSQFRVVLTDFGLARDEAATTRLSVTGDLMGTPQYMSPEQASGERVGPPTDVYAVGVVLYCMLSGRPPFSGAAFTDVLMAIRTADPPKLQRLVPDLPRDLCAVVEKALEKETAHRYSSALAFAQDCENFLKGEPVGARPPSLGRRLRAAVRRRRALSASLGSAALVGLAALLYALWIAPALARRAERLAFEQRRATFLARRAALEADARALLAAGRPLQMVERHERYSLRAGFPKGEFDWDERLEAMIPFDVPVVEAYVRAAREREGAGDASASLRLFMKAYFAGLDRADAVRPTFELAAHFLRQRSYEQAAYFLRKVLEREPEGPWASAARYLLGFAYSGAGLHDEAIAAFADASGRALPERLPDLGVSGPMTPMYALPPSQELLKEARDLSRIFVGPATVCEWQAGRGVAALDLDGDGRKEIVVAGPDRLDAYAFAGGRFEKVRTWPLDPPARECTRLVAFDADADGVEELLFSSYPEADVRLLKPEGERLRPAGSFRAHVHDAVASDLDGDGAPEILLVINHGFTVLQRRAGQWRTAFSREFGADIGGFATPDVDGDGRPDLLFTATIWSPQHQLRLHWARFDFERGELAHAGSRPVGFAGGPVAALPDGTVVLSKQSHGAAARTIELQYEAMGIPKELGLCAVELNGGELSEPRLLWGRPVERLGEGIGEAWPLESRGRPYLLAHLPPEGERRLIRRDGQGWTYLPLHFEDARALPFRYREARPCDLDGDGRPELLAFPDNRLVVTGLRPEAPAAAASASELATHGRVVDYQDALQSVRSLARAGDGPGAIRLLGELAARMPEFEKEILLRVAELHDRALDWPAVAGTLGRLRARFRLDDEEAGRLGAWQAEAEALAGMQQRAALDFRTVPLITNAPLRFRSDRAGGLRMFGQNGGEGFLAVPCAWDGSSYELRGRLRVWHLDFNTSASLSLSGGLEHFEGPSTQVFLNQERAHTLELRTWGNMGTPGTSVHLGSTAARFEAPTSAAWNAPVRPSSRRLDFSCRYVRHRDLLRAEIAAEAPLVTLEAPVRQRRQASRGFVVLSTGRSFNEQFWCELELDGLSVRSTGVFSLREAPPPRTALERALAAGGRFVRGDFAGAAELYRAALAPRDGELKGLELDPAAFLRETRFHLAFAEAALGCAAEGEQALARLFAEEAEATLGLLKINFAGMTEPERALVRRGFRAAGAGRPPGDLLSLATRALGPRGNSGLQILEILFFCEPEAPEEARRALAAVEEWVRANGMDFGIHRMVLLRCAARLARHAGRTEEALRLLEDALRIAESKEVDEFYRVPFARDLAALREAWTSEF